MNSDAPQYGEAGTAVRVAGGDLAIIAAHLDANRFLLVYPHRKLVCVIASSILQKPTQCQHCSQAVWYWEADFTPRCIICLPPDAEWRQRTFREAEDFIALSRRSTTNDLAWARRHLDLAMSIGGRYWLAVQKLSFAGTVPSFISEWKQM